MTWETPTFVEIIMSAEIGGYQSDFEDQDPLGPADPRFVGRGGEEFIEDVRSAVEFGS